MMNYTQPSGLFPSEFLLIGLSWIQNQRLGCSFLFLVMYMMVILGNCIMIILIWTDHRLHKPMHVYMLYFPGRSVNIFYSGFKITVILWLIPMNQQLCLFTQMFFTHTLCGLESSLFALML
ncbi:hypothetical protein GDO86_004795 [Hymenochirus boettgeri]|uniref:G-protein coupled receptors family 1 profile domain-containing protein n=1 Tax=Hymenochirus boettgeri TaxID=247094 RepID=A0A8T2K9Q3_9PIPI|nr:hypothetical protein GDO86_004795 [Hymenochirus boettgeri]